MENNRIALYTRVLQLQYDAAAAARHNDILANRVAEQRREIERLISEKEAENARHTAELEALRLAMAAARARR